MSIQGIRAADRAARQAALDQAFRERGHQAARAVAVHAAQQRAQKQAEREAVIASVFRWLSMARADFPELAPAISDTRLREIAADVADLFLAGE